MYCAIAKTPSAAKKRTVEQLFAKSRSSLLSWRNFRNILKVSPLGERVLLQIDKLRVLQGVEYLWKLSRHNLSIDELATLQVLASILYLLPDEVPLLRHARDTLLRKSFQTATSLDPMLVHYFTQHMLEHFDIGRHSSAFRFILNVSQFIASKSAMGKAVAVCLIWGIVFECGERSILIHQHRDLGELCSILDKVRLERIPIDRFCILVQSVGLLLHLMLCNKWLQEFLTYGYPFFYFQLQPQDGRHLLTWVKKALRCIKARNPVATAHVRCAAKKLLASLEYLDANSAKWCLACRSGLEKRMTRSCLLGDIVNK